MQDEAARAELLALIEQTKDYVQYLSALGVKNFEITSDDVLPPVQAALKREESCAPTGQKSALYRNATSAAETIAPSQTESTARSNMSESQQIIEQTKMAKRTSRKPSVAQPPAQETMFGEITPQDRASLPRPNETLEDIWADIGPQCMRCTLCCEGRTQVVNSTGNAKARLMFVGEAPGADEDAQGKPFVGRAGQLLNKIIEAIGMKRADVFIGNVNRCRPAGNRTPTPAEAKTCKPFLLREINIVRPYVIVVLGNTAMKNLLDTKEGITKLRGHFQDYNGIKVMPTFHPAYLLRDPTKKRETWDDMKKVRDYLNSITKGK
jgi:DNA polymerase